MRLWIKYLFGIVLGIAAALLLPTDAPAVSTAIATLHEFFARFGRYTLVPLLLFGVGNAAYKLRSTKMIARTGAWTAAVIVGTTLIVTVVGLASILLVALPRIPITGEKVSDVAAIDIRSLVMQLLPYSGLEAAGGAFLLPVFLFAGLTGSACATDETAAKPVIVLLRSAYRVFYSLMSFFVEWLSVGMIAIAAFWTMSAKPAFAAGTFLPLTIMLFVDFVLIVGLVYPVLLRLVCKDHRPWHVLYASLCPMLAAFFSGDANLALQVNWRHGRESLGVHSRVGGVTFPLFSVFGRGGAALACAICFVMVLRSYSPIGLKLFDVLWIFVMSFALSFALGGIPAGAPYVLLTVLCTAYSRGFDASYLLLRPAAPIFCSFAAAIDAASAVFGSYVVGVKTQRIEHIDVKHYL